MNLIVRPLEERDLEAALEVYRLDFRAALDVSDRTLSSVDPVRVRFRSHPEGALVAEMAGSVVGVGFVVPRGRWAVLGPVAVRPGGLTGKARQALIARAAELAKGQGCEQSVAFSFSHSLRHVDALQGAQLWPGLLTAVMSRSVKRIAGPVEGAVRVSELDPAGLQDALPHCDRLASAVGTGFSVAGEIVGVREHRLGDTVLLREEGEVVGFAVCHLGEGSEAGAGACAVKFAAVAPGEGAPSRFERLLDACDALAAAEGANRMWVGVNLAHRQVHAALRTRGFVPLFQGVELRSGEIERDPAGWVMDDAR